MTALDVEVGHDARAAVEADPVLLDEVARWCAVEQLVELVAGPAWRSLAEQRPGVDARGTDESVELELSVAS